MRAGNLTQTVRKRSVLKQLHQYAASSESGLEQRTGKSQMYTSAEFPCMVMEAGNERIVTAKTVISGNCPATVRCGIARAVNDLHIRGAVLEAVSLDIIFPETAEESEVKMLISQAIETVEYVNKHICKEGNQHAVSTKNKDRRKKIVLTVGNAEVNPAVSRILIHVTAQGSIYQDRSASEEALGQADLSESGVDSGQTVLSALGAAPGQDIILCGYAGLEGSLRILEEREEELGSRFVPAFLRNAKAKSSHLFVPVLDYTDERYGISAVYQVSGGGILAALWEFAEVSDIGLEIELPRISICQETVEICEFYRLNPYLTTSAGCVLFAAEHGNILLHALKEAGVQAVRIGAVTAEHARIITGGEEIRYLDRPAPDELMRWYRER